jgi:hypothetical protein
LDDLLKENIALFFGLISYRLFSIKFVCLLIESSPNDPPNANVVCFFGYGPLARVVVVAARSTSGMDTRAIRKRIDLYEKLTYKDKKPLTTLVELRSQEEAVTADPARRV